MCCLYIICILMSIWIKSNETLNNNSRYEFHTINHSIFSFFNNKILLLLLFCCCCCFAFLFFHNFRSYFILVYLFVKYCVRFLFQQFSFGHRHPFSSWIEKKLLSYTQIHAMFLRFYIFFFRFSVLHCACMCRS